MATSTQTLAVPALSIPLFQNMPQATELAQQRLAQLEQERLFLTSFLAHEGVVVPDARPQPTSPPPANKVEIIHQPKTQPAKVNAAFVNGRREAMEQFFAAGGHLQMTNKAIGKMFGGASKSLVSAYLNDAIKKGIAKPRTAPGGRAAR